MSYAVIPGTLGAYADTGGMNCNAVDTAPGLLSIYIVHTGTDGATAIEFSAPVPACGAGTASYLSWGTPHGSAVGNPVIGDPTAIPPKAPGASIAYGACRNTTLTNILVGTVSLFGSGLTPTCCYYEIGAHQISGFLRMTDCGTPFPALHDVTTVRNTINGNLTCPCGVTPTESSTWGGIKALYGE